MARTTCVYDDPSLASTESEHWRSLDHQPGDEVIRSLEELVEQFRTLVLKYHQQEAGDNQANGRTVALWSCIFGFCESLATSKKPERRFRIFPIPIGALLRLVQDEFCSCLDSLAVERGDTPHRQAVRSVSNWVWANVASKSNVKDELHANSLYVCLRGKQVDQKSLDCFGAALCTVIGMQCLGYGSMLALSEDHAYELHMFDHGDDYATCEVAVPGNTQLTKSKRGREIHETFRDKPKLSAATSWLYMWHSQVQCQSVHELLAAALANMNCVVEATKKVQLYSGPLFDLKRSLLWIMYQEHGITDFPYALMELGDCEEHRPSEQGQTWVQPAELGGTPCLKMEALYHEAVDISRERFKDGQVYPYCYMGNYHKDAGQEEEYRLVEALRCYAQASRVASGYLYDWSDSLQLTKVMVKLSEVIRGEILTDENAGKQWKDEACQIAAGTWLVAFFDSLLLWEERTEISFLPILTPTHRTGISKLVELLPHSVRLSIVARMAASSDENDASIIRGKPITSAADLCFFTRPRSRRLFRAGLLVGAMKRSKCSIGDMELAMVVESDDGCGRTKRSRRR